MINCSIFNSQHYLIIWSSDNNDEGDDDDDDGGDHDHDDDDDDDDGKAMGGSGGYCQSLRVSALLAPYSCSLTHLLMMMMRMMAIWIMRMTIDNDDGDEKVSAPKLCWGVCCVVENSLGID